MMRHNGRVPGKRHRLTMTREPISADLDRLLIFFYYMLYTCCYLCLLVVVLCIRMYMRMLWWVEGGLNCEV